VRLTVYDLMREHFPELRFACLGFYWPFQGEIDVRHLVRNFLAFGAEAALPVVVEMRRPLEFWSWRPRMKLTRGVWNIPVPSDRSPVQPTVLLVPLLGFDVAGYRLGYGGGYYDRTLATFAQKPLTIGIGYELGRLETIYPQPHDIPMDAIVTESGVVSFRCRDGLLGDAVRSWKSPQRTGA
jgi:5-formyltetrahydrofolate cyclo-ligase